MTLHNPVAVYNAANSLEAQLICNLLNDAGIEAHLTDDVSQVGAWLFGLMPELHKPQVWADRADMDRVKPLLEEYERQQLQRQHAEGKKVVAGDAIVEATCEECGRATIFPAAQEGSIQECPYCGAYMDIETSSDTEEWWREPGSGENAEER